jgi:hypothetical protein
MNKTKCVLKIITFIILSFIFVTSCDLADNRLQIINNSSSTICYDYSTSGDINPDSNRLFWYLSNQILPSKTQNISLLGSRNMWIKEIENSKTKRLSIFLFNVDTLKKYEDLNFIIKNSLYEKFDYSISDLEKNNWIINYMEK